MICESPGEIPGCDAKSYVCKHSELFMSFAHHSL